jgi:hypothetical protein
MRSSLLESVIVTEFQAADAYSSLDLTKAKYNINRLYGGKGNCNFNNNNNNNNNNINNDNSIQFNTYLFTCKLNSPEANYKVI